jgi:hypothetical protein
VDISIKNPISQITKPFYEFPSDVAAALIQAGIATPIVKAAPVPTEAGWYIGRGLRDKPLITLHLPSGEKRTYNGPPAGAADGFRFRRWSAEKQGYVLDGPVPPASVVEAYKRLYETPTEVNVSVSEADRNADLNRQQKEKELTYPFLRG